MSAGCNSDGTIDLLARARRGDAQALEVLFARHIPILQRWASRRLPQRARDLADTADLVQDTVIQTFKNLGNFEYRGEGSLQAYMRQGFMNRLRDQFRGSAHAAEKTDIPLSLQGDATSPLDAAIGVELLETYEAALQRLSQPERELIVSRVELGLSYREIATQSGRASPDAARMAVARTLLRLAEEMNLP